jgi:hypothetical protein
MALQASSASTSVLMGEPATPDGTHILREPAPRCHVAGAAREAGTAAALITDHEGKAVDARVPYSMSSTKLTTRVNCITIPPPWPGGSGIRLLSTWPIENVNRRWPAQRYRKAG